MVRAGPRGRADQEGSLTSFLAQPDIAPYFTLLVLGAMFVVFVLEIYPVEVTAMLGAAVLVVVGIVPSDGGAGGLLQPGALDDRGDVHRLGRAGAHRADQRLRAARLAPRGAEQGAGAVGGRAVRRRRLGLHQQHAARRGDDPGHGADRARDGAGAVEAADPALLPDGARRHDLDDRHLDQPARRRRGAGAGDGAVPPVRDRAARHRRHARRLRDHVAAGAALPAEPRLDGRPARHRARR